eukprot:1153434-Pelagomonas_calceolata.AAC.9
MRFMPGVNNKPLNFGLRDDKGRPSASSADQPVAETNPDASASAAELACARCGLKAEQSESYAAGIGPQRGPTKLLALNHHHLPNHRLSANQQHAHLMKIQYSEKTWATVGDSTASACTSMQGCHCWSCCIAHHFPGLKACGVRCLVDDSLGEGIMDYWTF